jgi:hypothetical protein
MLSNFVITVVGLGSVAYLLKSDVRHGGAMLRRNMKTIRSWLEEEGAAATKSGCAGGAAARRVHMRWVRVQAPADSRVLRGGSAHRAPKSIEPPSAGGSGSKPDARGPPS